LFGSFSTVLRSALAAAFNARGIQSASDDVVTHTRQILNTTSSDHNNAVFLQVVALTRDVGVDLLLVGQTNPSDELGFLGVVV